MNSATVLINLLLASAAFAAPSSEAGLQQRNAAAAGLESSTTKYLGEQDLPPTHSLVDFHYSWVGAIYTNNTNNTFQSVTAAVTIPDFKIGTVSVWVGLDGYDCMDVALHTGLNLTAGQVTPWYRLYPDDRKPFPADLGINTGDVVRMTVTTATDHFGFVQIENLNNTLSTTEQIWILNPDGGLCRSEAMWFATWYNPSSFETILFTDVMANTTAGVNIGPAEPGYNALTLDVAFEQPTINPTIQVDQPTRKITINR